MKLLIALAVCSLAFLATNAVAKDDDATAQQNELNGGFYLLHNLFDAEAQLPILLDLKTAPPELAQFADTISKSAKEANAMLDRMRDADLKMNFDKNPLPKIEQDVRASIKGEKQHQLLFGSKDREFARALLVSQAEASKYGANIAKVLSEQDPNPEHVRDLKHISAKWHALYDESFRLLRNY